MAEYSDLERTQTSLDDLAAQMARRQGVSSDANAWMMPGPIPQDEWDNAHATPDCIVQNYLYADVGVLLAAGGTGKTTLVLFEAIHIVLKRPLYGLAILRPGPVLILTAEDSREILVARLRQIAADLNLSNDEVEIVRRDVRISDLSAAPIKLTLVVEDVVLPSGKVDELIDGCLLNPPVLIIIDPAVSFGVGESRVNDAEQGLIEAARRMRNSLNCCVRYVHHTGKQNARDKTLDQYSNRGGSALPDGARMVAVMQPCDEEEWRKATGVGLHAGESGLILARPKLSYAPRPEQHIYIVRRGYRFDLVNVTPPSIEAALEALANQVWQFVANEASNGKRYTKPELEKMLPVLNMKRDDLRCAVQMLLTNGRLEEMVASTPGRRGAPSR